MLILQLKNSPEKTIKEGLKNRLEKRGQEQIHLQFLKETMSKVKIGLVQMTCTAEKAENLAKAIKKTRESAEN